MQFENMPLEVLEPILSNLSVFDMVSFSCSCVHLRSLFEMSILWESMDFSYSQISSTDTLSSYIKSNIVHAKKLNFERCKLLSNLRGLDEPLPNLKSLSLANCAKYDNYISLKTVIINAPNLRKLDLRGCTRLSSEKMHSLVEECQELTNLVTLTISNTAKDIVVESFLKKAPNLKTLDLLGLYKLTGECLYRLPSSLTSLNLGSVSGVDDRIIESISNQCKMLTSLKISKCPKITSRSLNVLSKFENLKMLFMSNCSGIKIDEKTEPPLLPNLTTINMGISDFDDNFITKLVRTSSNLVSLNVGSTRITDEGLMNVISVLSDKIELLDLTICVLIENIEPIYQCKKLSILDLSGCTKIDPSSIGQLGIELPSLVKLDLGNCNQINDDTVEQLSMSKTLRKLNLSGCPILTTKSVAYIQSLAEKVRIYGNLAVKHSIPGVEKLPV
eukprot:TRINITY_DN11324_c0_g1_i1.p1 TRINITY_DN11324_c0_g1~~TRINITY_DN11324_c0_g1_i1.p1  ORF type:complete len:445 (+),score=48.59 TRINITY_DN11324_c0_g1_i1:13-1347(+)